MKKLSRFFTLILLALSMLVSVSCESGEKKEKTKFIYEIVDGYAVITGYSGIEDEVSVPSTIEGNTVKAVAENAFKGMVGLKKLTLPDSVTIIDYAFSECPDLETVELGSGIVSMNGAFKDCPKLTSVSGGNSVKELSEAFMNCAALKSAYIPKTVTNCISSFRGCKSLTSVNIEEGVTALPYTFTDCTSLSKISIPSTVTEGVSTFKNCVALVSVTGIKNFSVLENTFEGCTALTSISLGDNIKILRAAFINCTSLTEIENLPSEVESYSPSFTGCTALTEMIIPKMPEDEAATYDLSADVKNSTALKKVTVNTSFFITGEFCKTFAGCASLTEVNIPNEAAKAFLRVDAIHQDKLFSGKNSAVTKAVNKYKKASNVRITIGFGFIGDVGYTHIYGGDVNFFSYEEVASSTDVIGFEPFTKSYYWCGYPNGTNRKSTTVAIEREYTFYLRVTGGNDGILPSTVKVNGMDCMIENT